MHNILKVAIIACDITEAHLSKSEFASVQCGANPHDIFDANISLYGAFAAVFFRECDAGNDSDCEIMNRASDICLEAKYSRAAIRELMES